MKASSIMVCPQVHLPSVLTDLERDVLRKVLFEGIQGIDEEHHRRWVRQMSRLLRSEPGEVTDFNCMRTRSLPFHRRWMAIERVVYENSDAFFSLKGFRRWLKSGAGLGEYVPGQEHPVFVPGSVSFDETSDDEMREFVKDAEAFLRTSRALKKLWPHLKSDARTEMLEALLKSADRQHEDHT